MWGIQYLRWLTLILLSKLTTKVILQVNQIDYKNFFKKHIVRTTHFQKMFKKWLTLESKKQEMVAKNYSCEVHHI